MIGWLILYDRIRRLEDRLDPPPPPKPYVPPTARERVLAIMLVVGLIVLVIALSACTTNGACAPYGTCTVERLK